MDHLEQLENLSIHIMREAYANFKSLGMLWSIGKDSTVMLWLVRKAFFGHVPFPLIHIDTFYKIPEMIEYRDRLTREWKLNMIYGVNESALKQKKTFPDGNVDRITCCRLLKTEALKGTISGDRCRYRYNHEKGKYELDTNTEPFTGIIAGARSDEEGSRSKERYFSPRDKESLWDVGDQPPEFWNQFKTDFAPHTHVRIHPLLDWTELNIWEYIKREKIPTVSLYYNQGKGKRYRSLGCYPCTFPIESESRTVDEIIEELRSGKLKNIAERSGRGPKTRMIAVDSKRSEEKDTCKVMTEIEHMNIAIVGHVDHGKSTIIGRLLADTASLPEGKLEQVRMNCERNSKPFEYAFLIDALKDEQSQGITIDSARVFFKTGKRMYTIIDAPGHIEFLKNMVTGASRAEAAFLVIDASEGVQENSRRHGTMLSMLGIQQIAVLINKMDLVEYQKKVYDEIMKEYSKFLQEIHIHPLCYIPVSGRDGGTIATHGSSMPWYTGFTVLEVLDTFEKEQLPIAKPFRMPVQDVYKFTKFGDSRRIVAGTVATGSITVGEEIVFYPSGKRSRIKTIEAFHAPEQGTASAGYATGLTLNEQIYVTRGEIAAKAGEPYPKVTTRLRTNLFWLGKESLSKKKEYLLKLGTAKIPIHIEEIVRVMDASSLSTYPEKEKVDRHEIAECIIKCNRAIAFDITEDSALTSRFVIVDGYEICGGGIVRQALEDKQAWVRDKVFLRNYKWEKSAISLEARAEKYNQKPSLIVITGKRNAGKKPIAKGLEGRLFTDGKIVYFLGIGNILYGVDADIKNRANNREEHIRRLAEVANILLDAGCILIITAIELTQNDLEIMKTVVNPERIEVVWVGEEVTTDIAYDLVIPHPQNVDDAVDRIKGMLQERGIIFKPW